MRVRSWGLVRKEIKVERIARVKRILAALSEDGWTRLSAGDGAKGPRWYDWRWLPLADPMDPDWRRGLLVRRSVTDPTDLTGVCGLCPTGGRAGRGGSGRRDALDH
jgi:hypothetical protein